MINPNGDEEKVIVDVETQACWSLTKMLKVAGQFAYRAQSIARFKRGESTYKVWYVDFTHSPKDGWRATKDGVPVPRHGHEWGELRLD